MKRLFKKVLSKMYYKSYYIHRKNAIKRNPIDIDQNDFNDFKSKCKFIFDPNNKKYYVDKLTNLNLKHSIIEDGEKICNHIFNLLGSGDKDIGKEICWNEDFKTGFKWKNDFYKDIEIIDLNNNADVKVPWELSRFQHILTLGKAYWITENEKYELEFKEEIQQWIEKNPVEMSVNWSCTMDVAIRAVNWIIGHYFFKDSKNINKFFWNDFNKVLYLHGRYIMKNLENRGQHTGNHYLSDISGLIWLGIYFYGFTIEDKYVKNNPKIWLEFALRELEKEMFIQVSEDGTNYEASTSYHRLVTEIFLVTAILCDRNKISLSRNFLNRLEKMCEFIMDITKPNGLVPLIGDADDGRLVVFSNYSNQIKRDFAHILAISGEYFNRDDFRYLGKYHKEDALWTLGSYKDGVEKIKNPLSKAYTDGGYYILRNKGFYCIIRCGQLSYRGEGGHSHNDQLSFELNVDGEDFIVDPGLYVYTADYNMRNLFRSTVVHNTVYVEGYEQNNFKQYDLFHMKEQSFAKCIDFTYKKFRGKHYGYKNKCGIVHERIIELDEDLKITDRVIIKKEMRTNIYCNFTVDKGVDICAEGNKIMLSKNGKKITMDLGNIRNIKIQDCVIAHQYGAIENSKSIIINIDKYSTNNIKIRNLEK